MGVIKTLLMTWLGISPAQPTSIQIHEVLDHKGTVLKNRIWYRGDPSELDQFFKGIAQDTVTQARFWSAVPSADNRIRKLHSGLPGEIVDKLSGIVAGDMDSIEVDPQEETIELGEGQKAQKPTVKRDSPNQERWNEIALDNKFSEMLEEAIKDTLVEGDGAFKLTIDTDITKYPIIEYVTGSKVEYDYKRGRLFEVQFPEQHIVNKKTYKRVEVYGYGYIKYLLFDHNDRPVPFEDAPELKLEDVFFNENVLMAIPMKFFKSNKFLNRGQSIYDRKTDMFDALDEVLSQWLDAVRAGRVKTYIPADMLPRNSEGMVLSGNPFDNQFIATGSSGKENAIEKIDQVQPDIYYEAYQQSYASFLDQCLQGILSPSTLGIDLKKTDNAEAQREKEKTTLYTRQKIVDVLNEVVPALVLLALQVEDIMSKKNPGEYEVSISFGEYASPDFTTVVETVGKAKSLGVMSLEKAIDEMYGDTMTDEEKALEVERIRGDADMTLDQEDAKEDVDPDEEDDNKKDDVDEEEV